MTTIYLGLDISKDKIDAVTYLHGHQINPNQIHACCESTNIYYLGIAQYLYSHQIKISVVNPIAIKAYAKMQLRRVKTDKQDAKLIPTIAV